MALPSLTFAILTSGGLRADVLLHGVTEFSGEVELSTMATGAIAEVKVRESRIVAAAEAPAELENDLQAARVAITHFAVGAVAPVDAARADLVWRNRV